MSVATLDELRPCPAPWPSDRAPEWPSFEDVIAASHAIAPYVARTPFYESPGLSKLLGAKVVVKYENHQPIGSFKIRGTVARLLELTSFECGRGVVTASQGNHGQGIAYGAQLLEIPATIVVPEGANPDKIELMEGFGARVVQTGADFEAATRAAWDLSIASCLTYIHPGNDRTIVAGHGTAGLEMLQERPDLDAIYVPVGGGGLAAGVGLVARALKPGISLVGVQSARIPAYVASLAVGRPVETEPATTFAEGIAVRKPSALPFAMVRDLVDDVIAVSEEEIRDAVLELLRTTHNLAEGAGAVALAGALRHRQRLAGKTIGIVLSGGNLSHAQLASIVHERISLDA